MDGSTQLPPNLRRLFDKVEGRVDPLSQKIYSALVVYMSVQGMYRALREENRDIMLSVGLEAYTLQSMEVITKDVRARVLSHLQQRLSAMGKLLNEFAVEMEQLPPPSVAQLPSQGGTRVLEIKHGDDTESEGRHST